MFEILVAIAGGVVGLAIGKVWDERYWEKLTQFLDKRDKETWKRVKEYEDHKK